MRPRRSEPPLDFARASDDDPTAKKPDRPRATLPAESLRHLPYRNGHGAHFRRRREWFDHDSSRIGCWWILAGDMPTVDDAIARLDHLAAHGPRPHAFTFANSFTPAADPGITDPGPESVTSGP